MKKIGYIEVILLEKSKQEIVNFSRTIRDEDLFTAKINGKIEGGNLTEKSHLTLFFGLNDKLVDKEKLLQYISSLKIESIMIEAIDMFPVNGYDCKILYLKVWDDNSLIKNINDNFKEFPYFTESQPAEFIPHITIAYVKNNFEITKLSNNFPKILYVERIVYKIKK
jgi:2'-5' RNA ligase